MKTRVKMKDYDKFRCTADQCTFSCCQQWGISIDEKTYEKWQGLKVEAMEQGNHKLPEITLCDCLEKDDVGHAIAFNQDKMCPLLDGNKLCRVVVQLGEEFLSETCTTFPRQINQFDDRDEYSFDFGCPVVVDLINENPGTIEFCEEGESVTTHSLLYVVREMILTTIGDDGYSLPERIMVTFYSLLELLDEKNLTEEIVNCYKNKKYLKSIAHEIRKMEFNPIKSFWERNELFSDIIQLYRKQKLYVDYLDDISLLAEKLKVDYSEATLLEKSELFEEKYVAYQNLLKNYLMAEIFASCLEADMELKDMVMVFEWIVLEYSVMKQAIFLKWLAQEDETLEYKTVRDHMMITSRMAGYNQGDIRDYLEHSFEDVIVDWGYMALLLGNGRI